MIRYQLQFVAVLVTICGCSTPSSPPVTNSTYRDSYSLVIDRSIDASNSEISETIEKATRLLRTKDGRNDDPPDYEIEITSVRRENVGPIDSQSDLMRWMGQSDERVIVVTPDLRWCGGPSQSAVGCAPVGGNGVIIIEHTRSLAEIIIAHEAGHVAGNLHRDAENAVMRAHVGQSHREIGTQEQIRYERQEPATRAFSGAPSFCVIEAPAGSVGPDGPTSYLARIR